MEKKQKKNQNIFALFLGIEYYIDQAMNDIWTNHSIKTFRI